MNISVSVSRKMVMAALIAVFLIGGASLAFANHDPDIVHVCVKENGQLVISDDGSCKGQETALTLATEAALAALQNSNSDLQARIDDLEALMKRLHGYTVAVLERKSSGSFAAEPGGYKVYLTFCDQPGCTMGDPGAYTLETNLLTEADRGAVITFDAGNNPDFAAIAALLTNGMDDRVIIETEVFDKDGNFKGGGSGSGPESSWFFRTPQVSTGPGFVDLAGLPLSNISISVDFIFLFYDGNSTSHSFDYRVFFGID